MVNRKPRRTSLKTISADILFSQRFYTVIAVLLLVFELALTYAVIQRVKYTEIDWQAYMQEVAGVVSGERNYAKLSGSTGPLVYPAGFVWLFGFLWRITDGGQNIRLAQYVFLGVYLTTQALVLALYQRARVPPVLVVLLVASRRMHSIYVLRLFNDCVAMAFVYMAVLAMCTRRWMRWSGLLLSAGLAVKMNVVLMLPGAAFLWWRARGWRLMLSQAAVIVISQAAVAAPFLWAYPVEYMNRAFDFGRQFDFTWTVNWRFVGAATFGSTQWALALVVVHALLLAVLGLYAWPRLSGSTAWNVLRAGCSVQKLAIPSADKVLLVMFSANFVGVVCARSLHYQFYSWYFHMLPFLLHKTHLSLFAQLGVWVAIEYAWNVYPSTVFSSALLTLAHLALLVALVHAMMAAPWPKRSKAQ